MRELLRANNILIMAIAAMVLASAANSQELLGTAGYPMVYTRILSSMD
jgi:hypothetical protein